MITIKRATEKDARSIAGIGKISVAKAHEGSCAPEILNGYIEKNYTDDAIKNELADPGNIYHIIYYNDQAAGFSKIVLNEKHDAVTKENVTKLDRIYLLEAFKGIKLGYELLKFNINFAKKNDQSGMWLYTWVGNNTAINFYKKMGFEIIGSHRFYVSGSHWNLNHHMYLNF